MCQLTFINTRHASFNAAALYITAAVNSKFLHKDGWGFYNKNSGVVKTELSANIVTNAGGKIRNAHLGTAPIMSHVRRASKGIEVNVENVHPFELDEIVLMHNGTLWFEEELKEETTTVTDAVESRPSDSLHFANMLNAELKVTKDFVTAFNNCMSKCRGKFAMIIYVKREDTYYICRGRTANLHIADVWNEDGIVGFIVNTDKSTLEDEEIAICNVAQLQGCPLFVFGKTELLKEETIYKVDGLKLVEVGHCTENPLPVKQPVRTTWEATTKTSGVVTGVTSSVKGGADSAFDRFQGVANYMARERLKPTDIDALFVTLFGNPIASCSEQQIDLFLKYAIGGLGSRRSIRDLLDRLGVHILWMTVYNNLQFPLGLEDNFQKCELTLKSIYEEAAK